MAPSLEGTVLVSGGTGGLGRSVLADLLDAGARVVSTWLMEREVEAVREDLGEPENLKLIKADISTDEGAAAAVEAAAGDGPLAGLANLVGGFTQSGRLHEAPPEDFERMLELNLMTSVRLTRAALPRMIDAGGSIVCVGAKYAVNPFPGATGTIVSKAALLSLVGTLATEYRDEGVRVNAILPSVIDTPANRASQPDADYSSWVEPAEIARVVRFLLSPDSGPVSGALIPVYGRAG